MTFSQPTAGESTRINLLLRTVLNRNSYIVIARLTHTGFDEFSPSRYVCMSKETVSVLVLVFELLNSPSFKIIEIQLHKNYNLINERSNKNMENRKTFNKLVRDKIPEILEKNGAKPETQILDDSTYLKLLDEKLLEECKEVINAEDSNSKIEELADILEVIRAIFDTLNVTFEQIEKVRLEKQEKRGAFKSKILLKSAVIVEKLK
ncbi:MAG: nucleoside triphosphate pyrophosphohydrolase [Oscillospiraceae bacterium]|nr:nucleoside triphosphate pyrophosphohydrolase [Oscillospiraceae bacterium]